ncbi:MAG: phage head closure protein [Lachnospiraceae bacterium]|nr:phage head closure protein [Lachnospiraceae bacterium]
MRDFKPNTPYTTPFFLLKTKETKRVKGVEVKQREKEEKPRFCTFKTFGGTEKEVNNVTVVENTATVETWYTPDIKADSAIEVNGIQYEILGTPENINMRNQYMQIKVRAVKGSA